MSVSNTRFNLIFGVHNLRSLNLTRTVIRGIGQQSYISSNAFSRSMSAMERRSSRAFSRIDRSAKGLGRTLRGLGTGVAIGGLLALAAGVSAIGKAFVNTNSQMHTARIMLEGLIGSRSAADSFINSMKDMSATFGADITEVFASGRGLMQVMKQIPKEGESVQVGQFEKLQKMVMAVSAMDLENRGLTFTAFSFKEAFQGQGLVDFRSLRNRLEINLGRETEKAITAAIKDHDLNKAIQLFDDGLKRIGIDSEKLLNRLTREGLTQNLNRTSSYITRTFQVVGEDVYKFLTKPIWQFNEFIAKNFKEGSAGFGMMRNFGKGLANSFRPAIKFINEFGQQSFLRRFELVTNMSKMIKNSMEASVKFVGMFGSFIGGMTGSKGGGKNSANSFINAMGSIGNFASKSAQIFAQLHEPLRALGTELRGLFREVTNLLHGSGVGIIAGVKILISSMTELTRVTKEWVGWLGKGIQGQDADGNKGGGTLHTVGAVAGTALTAFMLFSMLKGGAGKVAGMFGRGRGAAGGIGGTSAAGASGAGAANLGRAGGATGRPFQGLKEIRQNKISDPRNINSINNLTKAMDIKKLQIKSGLKNFAKQEEELMKQMALAKTLNMQSLLVKIKQDHLRLQKARDNFLDSERAALARYQTRINQQRRNIEGVDKTINKVQGEAAPSWYNALWQGMKKDPVNALTTFVAGLFVTRTLSGAGASVLSKIAPSAIPTVTAGASMAASSAGTAGMAILVHPLTWVATALGITAYALNENSKALADFNVMNQDNKSQDFWKQKRMQELFTSAEIDPKWLKKAFAEGLGGMPITAETLGAAIHTGAVPRSILTDIDRLRSAYKQGLISDDGIQEKFGHNAAEIITTEKGYNIAVEGVTKVEFTDESIEKIKKAIVRAVSKQVEEITGKGTFKNKSPEEQTNTIINQINAVGASGVVSYDDYEM